MSRIEDVVCAACGGEGGSGPLRKSTGRPFRECIQCDGFGMLVREIWDTPERVAHMATIGAKYGPLNAIGPDGARLHRKRSAR